MQEYTIQDALRAAELAAHSMDDQLLRRIGEIAGHVSEGKMGSAVHEIMWQGATLIELGGSWKAYQHIVRTLSDIVEWNASESCTHPASFEDAMFQIMRDVSTSPMSCTNASHNMMQTAQDYALAAFVKNQYERKRDRDMRARVAA